MLLALNNTHKCLITSTTAYLQQVFGPAACFSEFETSWFILLDIWYLLLLTVFKPNCLWETLKLYCILLKPTWCEHWHQTVGGNLLCVNTVEFNLDPRLGLCGSLSALWKKTHTNKVMLSWRFNATTYFMDNLIQQYFQKVLTWKLKENKLPFLK